MWRHIGAVAVLCLLAGCAGISQSTPQPVGQAFERLNNSQTSLQPARHLYVSDPGAHAILRFPLHGGIPAAQPDAVIGGFSLPHGIAIGPDGRLYAIDKEALKLLIFAPAPDSDSKPVRVISIGHRSGVGTVAVDPSGNTYVAYTLVCTTEGFSCGYTDVYSPFSEGSHFLITLDFAGGPPGAIIRSIAFDPAGRMVEESSSQGPVIYNDALKGGANYFIYCGAENDSGNLWGPAKNELFETDLGAAPKPPQLVVIPDYTSNSDTHCPSFYTITSATIPLTRPNAIATNGTYVYVTDGHSSRLNSGVVLVFNPSKPGLQTPVAALDGAASKLREPIGIAIGP